jgi:hypothetical protein
MEHTPTLDEQTLRKIYDLRCSELCVKDNERFWTVLQQQCVNRKLYLSELGLGIQTAKKLEEILLVNNC